MASRSRTPVPSPVGGFTGFTVEQTAAYLRGQGVRVVPFRGRLWRNAPAPSPIASRDWTPVARWTPLAPSDAGFPTPTALAYRCLSDTQATGTFDVVVFGEVDQYDEYRITRKRANLVRRVLSQFEYTIATDPGILQEQGWNLARAAARDSGMALPRRQATYRARLDAMFDGQPPTVVVARRAGRLASYLVTYATCGEAMVEKVYIDPQERRSGVGLGLYWTVLRGWAQTPGVRNVWTGASMPHTQVDHFKVLMGAQVRSMRVHAGMRAPVRWAARGLRPDAVSLAALGG